MALVPEALYDHLNADAGLTALVGDRIYPNTAPQRGTMPQVVLRTASAERYYSHGGPSQVADVRVEISCWSKSYLEAKKVADAVRKAIEGSQKGTIGTTSTLEVMGMRLENEIDTYDDETHFFRTIVDVLIPHRET